jgi:hypothetical protein
MGMEAARKWKECGGFEEFKTVSKQLLHKIEMDHSSCNFFKNVLVYDT